MGLKKWKGVRRLGDEEEEEKDEKEGDVRRFRLYHLRDCTSGSVLT